MKRLLLAILLTTVTAPAAPRVSAGLGYYAMGKHPLGPFTTPEENIVLRLNKDLTTKGPGHNSVLKFKDRYYIVYHQHNQPHEDAGGVFRQACADLLEFNADGTIKEVVPTQTGVGALLPLMETGDDMAFGKYARATSVRNGFYSPEYALDRNNASKWCAATNANYPQALTVDLGGPFDIGRVETSFEYPTLAYQYAIETSLDGKSWTMFADRTGATPPAVSPHRDSGTAKAAFVRITVTGCERPENAAGIYSFKVFRAADTAGTAPLTSHAAWGDWQTWGDQGDGTYRNPVMPSDYSDLDCIRVGPDYYAISSTFQYSPGVVILQSKDLVNWRIAGHAVPDVSQIGPEMNWTHMDRFGTGVWAGAIRHHAGKFWVYFGTPQEGYFMTTATNVAGPWEPLTCLKRASGWDDCCPFWDDDGQGYFIGSQFDKDPVNGKKYNIHLWKLTSDGKALVEGSDRILYQSHGSEANKLFKWNGAYYHYFSEVRGEGRVPMMGRAKAITGPYEYRQIGHVKSGVDYEPNQGGLVQSEAGDWWFFTHHGSGDWSGRVASLLPVTWINGWPIIGKPGADGIGNMVWSAIKPVKGTKRLTPQTDDEFSAATLAPQWEWHYQPRAEKWSLTERPGFLRLHAFKGLDGDNLLKIGNVLTQRPFRTTANVVTVKLDTSGMANGQSAGLFHYTTAGYAGVGVSQTNGRRFLIYRSGLRVEPGDEVKGTDVWLRTSWGLDGIARFSRSLDGQNFEPFSEAHQMKWASYRGERIGLFNYNRERDAGFVDFDWFHYEYAGQASAAEETATELAAGDETLLFTYFRHDGVDGVHLAMTTNGVDFVALNDDKAVFAPPTWPGQNLTRDASILYHDGKFRMVWTSGWKGRIFGYAESDDLVHWSVPRQITPFSTKLPAEDQPDNIWAPELHFDPLKNDYFVLFASTIPRERDDDDDSNNNGKRGSQYDNRVFITRTSDFQSWSEATVLFDRDFASIDAVMRRDEVNARWVMVIKCSRDENLKTMPGRNLWLTHTGLDMDKLNFAPLEGPIAGNHSPMFSNPAPRKAMAEGPSLLWVKNKWLLTWDEPAGGGMQLATSTDLKAWTHIKSAKFPHPAQHGTLFLAPRDAVGWLDRKTEPDSNP